MSQAAEAAAAAGAAGVHADQDFSDGGEGHIAKSGVGDAAAAAAGGLGFTEAAAAAAAAGGVAAGFGDLPGKRHRWVAGTNQWVMEDGVVIWPRVSAGLVIMTHRCFQNHTKHVLTTALCSLLHAGH
jgi:hypothetical protein